MHLLQAAKVFSDPQCRLFARQVSQVFNPGWGQKLTCSKPHTLYRHCTLYTIQLQTLYTRHYTATDTVQYTLYSIHYTVWIIKYTLYSIHYTLYTIQYTLCSIHYTVYTIQQQKTHHLYYTSVSHRHFTIYTIQQ